MRRYILDADILCYFQRAGRLELLARQATECPWVLVDEVEDELFRAKGYGDAALRVLREFSIPVVTIADGSREAALLERLHPGKDHPNCGEAASIAVATYDTDLIFVTNDQRAATLALVELYSLSGERCIRTPTFLRRLHELRLFTSEDIRHWLKINNRLTWPSWWEAWSVDE